MFRPGNVPHNKGNKVTVELFCFGCGQTFQRMPCEAKKSKGRFYCSLECYYSDPSFKLCVECGEVLPIEKFGKQGSSKLTGRQYYRPRCKTCDAPHKYLQQEKRRARKANVLCDLTQEDWDSIQAQFENHCAYCGEPLGDDPCQDHFIPLVLGGPHTASNVLPSCRRCNSSKNGSHPQEWLGKAKFRQLSSILDSLG